MNLNATLIAQFVVFFILAWFTMKFVWPPVMNALDERAARIASGLAAADRAKAEMAEVSLQTQARFAETRAECQKRIDDADRRALAIIEDAKKTASEEAARIIAAAKMETEQQVVHARDELRAQVAVLAIKGASQILRREVDAATHADLLSQLETEL